MPNAKESRKIIIEDESLDGSELSLHVARELEETVMDAEKRFKTLMKQLHYAKNRWKHKKEDEPENKIMASNEKVLEWSNKSYGRSGEGDNSIEGDNFSRSEVVISVKDFMLSDCDHDSLRQQNIISRKSKRRNNLSRETEKFIKDSKLLDYKDPTMKKEVIKKFKKKIDEVYNQMSNVRDNLKKRSQLIQYFDMDRHNDGKGERQLNFDYKNSKRALINSSKATLKEKMLSKLLTKPHQRYKLRSKSVPERKFGFGSYSNILICKFPASRSLIHFRKYKENMHASRKRKLSPQRKSHSKKNRGRAYSNKNDRQKDKLPEDHSRNENSSDRSDSEHFSRPVSKSQTDSIRIEEIEPSENPMRSPQTLMRKEESKCNIVAKSTFNSEVAASKSAVIQTEAAKSKQELALMQVATIHQPLKPSLLVKPPKPIPFVCVSSTSRSYNLGLNIQQVMSLLKKSKSKVKAEELLSLVPSNNYLVSLDAKLSTTVHDMLDKPMTKSLPSTCPALTLEELGSSASSVPGNINQRSPKYCESRTGGVYAKLSGDGHRRPQDIWCVDQETKSQCKCTCYPTRKCIDYHKLIEQYVPRTGTVNGIKKLFSNSNMTTIGNRIEINKMQHDVVNLQRKYVMLQQHINTNSLDRIEAKAEIETLESELEIRESEFKDLISIYSELISLRQSITAMREQNATRISILPQETKGVMRTTNAMTLTKFLRQIQEIQEKIKEVKEI